MFTFHTNHLHQIWLVYSTCWYQQKAMKKQFCFKTKNVQGIKVWFCFQQQQNTYAPNAFSTKIMPRSQVTLNHSVAGKLMSNLPPWSPGESPSRTQEPPSTQKGFESKKGPQKEPCQKMLQNLILNLCSIFIQLVILYLTPLIHFVVALHRVLASPGDIFNFNTSIIVFKYSILRHLLSCLMKVPTSISKDSILIG